MVGPRAVPGSQRVGLQTEHGFDVSVLTEHSARWAPLGAPASLPARRPEPLAGKDAGAPSVEGSVVISNLFLHHFEEARLAELLRGIARVARVFVALEPRRSRWALAASRNLWAIGCNGVTRHDAPVSVRAGFAGDELSRLWPADGEWQLAERRAGWFSHLIVAKRRQ